MNNVARLTSSAALPDDPATTDPAALRLSDALRNFPPDVSEAIVSGCCERLAATNEAEAAFAKIAPWRP